jgi:flagellar motor switch protein FliN/FliY
MSATTPEQATETPAATVDEAAQAAAFEALMAKEKAAASDTTAEAVTAAAAPAAATPGKDVNLDVILDVTVALSMEAGRTRVPIRNLLQLNQGSVVELDRAAGEPLDVYVNGTLIAHGEVVVVNDKFGIRLTDVISPAERIRKLR